MSELGLRYYREDAVRAVEKAIVNGQQEILLAMATGTGKTRTAIALMFRLIQSQRFKRVLFWLIVARSASRRWDRLKIHGLTATLLTAFSISKD